MRLAFWGCVAAAALCGLILLLLGSPAEVPGGPGFAAPHDRELRDTVRIAMFWAAGVNLAVALVLAATAGFWARPLTATPPQALPTLGRGAIGLILLAVIAAGALRLPFATKSLWWDEGWSLSRVVRGHWRPDPDRPGELQLQPAHWARTFWYYRKPTNHVFYNVTARGSLDAWRAAAGKEPHEFDELVFRGPALLASMASVVAIALLAWRWGFPRAGVAAAWLLALHPWHIRYGVDGRAYSFVALFTLLSAIALTEALRTRSWRWFSAYAAVQLALLWTHPFAIHLTLALGMGGLAGCLWPRDGGPALRERITLGARFVAVNAVTGAVLLQLMAPNFAQALAWETIYDAGRYATRSVALDYWSHLTTGMALREARPPDDPTVSPSLQQLAETGPWVEPTVFLLFPILALCGLVRLRSDGAALPVAAGLAISVPLTMVLVNLGDQLYYHRFLFFGLPVAVLAFSLGADALASPLARRARALPAVVLAACLVGYQLLVLPQTKLLLRNPYAPLRDVAEFFQRQPGATPDGVLRAGYGLEGRMIELYDPWVRYLDDAQDLAGICAEANRQGKPLFVAYGQPNLNRKRRPEGFRWLDDPALFEEVARYPGVEPRFLFKVFRYTGQALPALAPPGS